MIAAFSVKYMKHNTSPLTQLITITPQKITTTKTQIFNSMMTTVMILYKHQYGGHLPSKWLLLDTSSTVTVFPTATIPRLWNLKMLKY